jgi:hypothetical protein
VGGQKTARFGIRENLREIGEDSRGKERINLKV